MRSRNRPPGPWQKSRNMSTPQQSDQPDDGDRDEQLFAWAVVAPVLQQHYSIVLPADRGIAVCACSPQRRRTIVEWARHVSDEVARGLG